MSRGVSNKAELLKEMKHNIVMHPFGFRLQPLVLPELPLEFYFHASSGLARILTIKITRENMLAKVLVSWLMVKH